MANLSSIFSPSPVFVFVLPLFVCAFLSVLCPPCECFVERASKIFFLCALLFFYVHVDVIVVVVVLLMLWHFPLSVR